MNHDSRFIINYVTTILIFLVLFSACTRRNEGPMERAGERADEIVDNAREGKPLLHKKGPIEKTGEAIDEAFEGD
jgi:hypothetical protein